MNNRHEANMKNKGLVFVFASTALGLMSCTSTTDSVNSMGHNSHYVANTYHATAKGYKTAQSKTYQNTSSIQAQCS